MALGQERMKIKRGEVDAWSVKEQLCLAAAVLRSGDQNWMTVSRMLRPFGDPSRPPEWYSQKNCAVQYSSLLENVETPKRKKRNEKGESQVETPSESICRKLTQERIEELKRSMQEKRAEFMKLKDEIAQVKNGSADDRLDELCQQIDEEKKQKEKMAEAHALWLKEREKRDADRTWKPPVPPPAFPHRRKVNRNVARRNSNQSDPSSEADSPLSEPLNVDVINEDTSESQAEPKPPPTTPTSPLLTSLLKSPSPAPTSQSSSILHSAITSHRGSSPTITSLLNSAPGIPASSASGTVAPPSAVSSSLKNLVSSAISGAGTDHPPAPASSPAAGAPTLSMLLELPPSLPGKPLPELPSTITPPSTIATVSSASEEVCHPQHEELRVRPETGTDEHVEVVDEDMARPKEEPVEVLIEEGAKDQLTEGDQTEPELKNVEKMPEPEQSSEQTTMAPSKDLCSTNSSEVVESEEAIATSGDKKSEALGLTDVPDASGENEVSQSITTEADSALEEAKDAIQMEEVTPCGSEVPDLANMEVIILDKSQQLEGQDEPESTSDEPDPDKKDVKTETEVQKEEVKGTVDESDSDKLKDEFATVAEAESSVQDSSFVPPSESTSQEGTLEADLGEKEDEIKAKEAVDESESKNTSEKQSRKKNVPTEEELPLKERKIASKNIRREKESHKEEVSGKQPSDDDLLLHEKDIPSSSRNKRPTDNLGRLHERDVALGIRNKRPSDSVVRSNEKEVLSSSRNKRSSDSLVRSHDKDVGNRNKRSSDSDALHNEKDTPSSSRNKRSTDNALSDEKDVPSSSRNKRHSDNIALLDEKDVSSSSRNKRSSDNPLRLHEKDTSSSNRNKRPSDNPVHGEKDMPTDLPENVNEKTTLHNDDDTSKDATSKSVSKKESNKEGSKKDLSSKGSSKRETSKKEEISKERNRKEILSKEEDKTDFVKENKMRESPGKDDSHSSRAASKRDLKDKKEVKGSKKDVRKREGKTEARGRDSKDEGLEKDMKENYDSKDDQSNREDSMREISAKLASNEHSEKESIKDTKEAHLEESSPKDIVMQDTSERDESPKKEPKRKEASVKDSNKKDTSKKDENKKESFRRSVSREEKKEDSKKPCSGKDSSKKDISRTGESEMKGRKRPCEDEAKIEPSDSKKKSWEDDDSNSLKCEAKRELEHREDAESEKKESIDIPKSPELEDSAGNMEDKTEKVSVARPETPSTEDDKTNDAEPPRGIGKKRLGASTPSDSVPNSPAASITDEEREYRVWKKSIMLVYGRLATHKYASLFLRPITDDQAPGYSSLVHRPIDLLMIKKNIETGVTRTTIEFQRDVMLMFCNSIMYNKSSHFVHRMACQMQEECLQHIQDFLTAQMLVQTVGETPHRRETRTTEANKHKDIAATPGSVSQDEGEVTAGGKRKRVSESEKGAKKRKIEDSKDSSTTREIPKEKT